MNNILDYFAGMASAVPEEHFEEYTAKLVELREVVEA